MTKRTTQSEKQREEVFMNNKQERDTDRFACASWILRSCTCSFTVQRGAREGDKKGATKGAGKGAGKSAWFGFHAFLDVQKRAPTMFGEVFEV